MLTLLRLLIHLSPNLNICVYMRDTEHLDNLLKSLTTLNFHWKSEYSLGYPPYLPDLTDLLQDIYSWRELVRLNQIREEKGLPPLSNLPEY